jgi:hypothetical protein
VAGGIILAGVFALQLVTNLLQVSDDRTFASFQRDSEALVVGKIVSERVGVPIPMRDRGVARANLALGWVDGVPPSYEAGIATVLQGYYLLDARVPLPDVRLARVDYDGPGWVDGVFASGAGMAVAAQDRSIARYIGRYARVDGQSRIIQSATFQGNVALLRFSGPALVGDQVTSVREVAALGQPIERNVLRFNPYTSQYGLQGLSFAWASEALGLTLDSMYVVTAAMLGCVLAALALLYARIFGLIFWAGFVACMLLSPWITNYGRNIYWVPFTWFLPAVFLGIGLLSDTILARTVAAAGFFLAVLLKCLCGYEYLSTVILFAAAPCMVALAVPVRAIAARSAAIWCVAACALGACAFAVALVCQSPLKAPTVWQGVSTVIEQDALRRTHGDPSAFSADGDAVSSLSQTTWSVVWRYVFQWRTDLLAGIPGAAFGYLLVAAAVVAVGRAVVARSDRWRYGVMLAAFIVPAVSWYVLGKGHSARHYHMNYVLWYMGAVPVCIWICLDTVLGLIRRAMAWKSAAVAKVGRQAPVARQPEGQRRGRRNSRK